MKRLNQYYTVFCVNFLSVAFGIIVGWASPILPILQSDESPLPFGILTEDQTTWLSAVISIGSITGSFILGSVAERFGRKIALYTSALTLIVSWLLLIFSTYYPELLIARLLGGIGGGGTVLVVSLFVVEIAENEIRGKLGSALPVVANAGMVLGYVWGGYLNYYLMSYLSMIFPVIFIIGFWFIPETPAYLASRNKMEEAEKSLRFFRREKEENYSTSFLEELESLKLKPGKNILENSSKKLMISDFTKKSSRKPILLGIVLYLIMQANGGFVVVNYIGSVFKDAGTTISPIHIAIICGVVFTIGTYLAAILVDHIGRRPLLIYSSLTTGIFMSITGMYFLLKFLKYEVTDYSWISVISIVGALFNLSWGLIALPAVVVNEMLPIKIRGKVAISLTILSSTVNFSFLKCFFLMKNALEVHGCLFFFAFNCFLTTIILFIWLPETKKKPINEIVKSLEN